MNIKQSWQDFWKAQHRKAYTHSAEAIRTNQMTLEYIRKEASDWIYPSMKGWRIKGQEVVFKDYDAAFEYYITYRYAKWMEE